MGVYEVVREEVEYTYASTSISKVKLTKFARPDSKEEEYGRWKEEYGRQKSFKRNNSITYIRFGLSFVVTSKSELWSHWGFWELLTTLVLSVCFPNLSTAYGSDFPIMSVLIRSLALIRSTWKIRSSSSPRPAVGPPARLPDFLSPPGPLALPGSPSSS